MRQIYLMILSTILGVAMSQAVAASAPLTATPNHAVPVATAPLTATLEMHETDKRLYARILVTQGQPQTGKITVHWTPPKGSICLPSTYDLSYQGKRYHTQCYRTVVHVIKAKVFHCLGEWHIEVRDANNVSLAQTTYAIATPGIHHD